MVRMMFVLALSLVVHSEGRADSIDANSPIHWHVFTAANGKFTHFDGPDIARVIKDGYKNDELKLSCKLEFNKGFSKKIKSGNRKEIGGEYNEKVWVSCKLHDVDISINAIGCTKSNSHFNDFDSQAIQFNMGQAEINVVCDVKL